MICTLLEMLEKDFQNISIDVLSSQHKALQNYTYFHKYSNSYISIFIGKT